MEIRVSKSTTIAVVLIIFGVVLRLIPHVDNFAPIGAIALFGGAILSARIAWWLPLAIMVMSDLILGLHDTILFTWGGFMLVALFGMLLKDQRNIIRVPLGAIGAAVIFFIVSNFGVWVVSGMYAHTWQGLIDCYVMAIPFFKTSLLADFVYSAALFGAYAWATQTKKARLEVPKQA